MQSETKLPHKKLNAAETQKRNLPQVMDANRCKVCLKPFETIQTVMQHEIMAHSHKKRKLNKKIKHVICLMQNEETYKEREALLTELNKCEKPEDLLPAVLRFFRLDLRKVQNDVNHIQYDIVQAFGKPCYYFWIFGSTMANMALKDSDIDIFAEELKYNKYGEVIPYLTHPTNRPHDNRERDIECLRDCEYHLRKSRRFRECLLLRHARVPILKCTHIATGRMIDINFTSSSSMANTYFLKQIVCLDERLYQLILFFKVWSKHYRLIEQGSFTSHALTMLVFYALQQPINSKYAAILPSMYDMQKHLTRKIMYIGVNYGHDLKLIKPIPKEFTTLCLIGHVFTVWKNLDFECIISPYYGINTHNKHDITNLGDVYNEQLETRAQYYNCLNKSELEIKPGLSICLQDIFCMSFNITKNVPEHVLEYFKERIDDSYKLCKNVKNINVNFFDAMLYAFITNPDLVEVKKEIAQEEVVKKLMLVAVHGNLVPEERSYTFHLSREERKALRAKIGESNENLLEKWINIYIDVIKRMLTDVFLLEMRVSQQNPSTSALPAEQDDTHNFKIKCVLNTWQNRIFERSGLGKPFFEREQERSKKLIEDADQSKVDEKYLFDATVTIIVNKKREEITLKIRHCNPDKCMPKNSYLYSFFSALKTALQVFNLKDYLKTLE